MSNIIERLREESQRLSGRSLDRGCVDSGIASNLAVSAAYEIERLTKQIETAKADENEACALACDAEVERHRQNYRNSRDVLDAYYVTAATNCAAAVRALSDEAKTSA